MWSIGIYTGASPFQLQPPHRNVNPVLTHASVTDIPAEFVADPFMVCRNGGWFMFFEVMNRETGKGEIGLATSDDGFDWTYRQVVLNEPYHLSYPYVFKYQDEYYMAPETLDAAAVCLYKADEFPIRWSLVARLIEGSYADPSILRFGNLWWMFVCSTPYQHDVLRLYFAANLTGPWQEHPDSPIIKGDKCRARPAGRILELNDRAVRFAQDCMPQYGTRVRAFEVSELTASRYVEVENNRSPILKPAGGGWNALGMHHVDAHRQPGGEWLACVDGFSS